MNPKNISYLKYLFSAIIALGLIAIAALFLLPPLWARAAPQFLHENIGPFLVVDKAEFSRSPPELILTGVHLLNRAEFGAGDAVSIGHINVVFNNYNLNSPSIKLVTVKEIRGRLIKRGGTDNLEFLHAQLMDRKFQTPRGKMAEPVKMGSLIIHDSIVQSEDGTIVTPLTDKKMTPAQEMAQSPPLQKVIIDILGTVIEQQQAGTKVIVLENTKDKAIDELGKAAEKFKAIGDAIGSTIGGFFLSPNTSPEPAVKAPVPAPVGPPVQRNAPVGPEL